MMRQPASTSAKISVNSPPTVSLGRTSCHEGCQIPLVPGPDLVIEHRANGFLLLLAGVRVSYGAQTCSQGERQRRENEMPSHEVHSFLQGISMAQWPSLAFPVTPLDRFRESLARSCNGRDVALEDEIQTLHQVDIDWRRHRDDETVLVKKMSMTEWQYERFTGHAFWNQSQRESSDLDFRPIDPHSLDGRQID
jgi:hypothetical protein